MQVVIEIPKGDNRRRHVKTDKSGFVDLGLIKDTIPVNDGVMPVDYGYIPGTLNKKEGDEIDVLVLSNQVLQIGQEIEVEPVALIRREDQDDKIVAVDETKKTTKTWPDVPVDLRDSIERFFSYHHKFSSIESAEAAEQYIETGREQYLRTSKKVK